MAPKSKVRTVVGTLAFEFEIDPERYGYDSVRDFVDAELDGDHHIINDLFWEQVRASAGTLEVVVSIDGEE